MTKLINPGLMKTSRRNVLRGSVLAGAAAMTGAAAMSAPRTPKMHGINAASSKLYKAAVEQGSTGKPADLSGYTRVKQKLVRPPFAPEHEQVATGGPKIIEITMETREVPMVVDEDTGASIWALTYNGSVPGPLIICHQGDMVELTLRNPTSSMMEHNIDFHASTGALGGGGLTHVYPGEETVLRWKATKPGCFTYHCAPGGAMIPYHVTHGMNGAVMVLPRDGLKDQDGNTLRYDRIAYIGEQDFYLPKEENGDYRNYSSSRRCGPSSRHTRSSMAQWAP